MRNIVTMSQTPKRRKLCVLPLQPTSESDTLYLSYWLTRTGRESAVAVMVVTSQSYHHSLLLRTSIEQRSENESTAPILCLSLSLSSHARIKREVRHVIHQELQLVTRFASQQASYYYGNVATWLLSNKQEQKKRGRLFRVQN